MLILVRLCNSWLVAKKENERNEVFDSKRTVLWLQFVGTFLVQLLWPLHLFWRANLKLSSSKRLILGKVFPPSQNKWVNIFKIHIYILKWFRYICYLAKLSHLIWDSRGNNTSDPYYLSVFLIDYTCVSRPNLTKYVITTIDWREYLLRAFFF
jgi:hypothetical protein